MESLWDEIQRGLTDSVCRLDQLIGRFHLLVEQRSDESFGMVDRGLEKATVKSTSLNKLDQINAISSGAFPSSGIHPSSVVRTSANGNSNCASLNDEGEFWTIVWDRMTLRIKNSKGARLLSVLIENPDRQFHVMDLERCERKDQPIESASGFRHSDAGPMLDASAKKAYKTRLAVLGDQVQEAQRLDDIPRESKIREEMALVVAELARASGLNGRNRRAISDVERARVRVTLAVKGVIDKISRYNSSIGDHLAASIRTGVFCLYCPGRVLAPGDDGPVRG
jgi:hypothetical protein